MKYAACFLAVALATVSLVAPAAGPQSPWGPSNNPMNGAGVAHNAYLGCLLTLNPNGDRSPLEVLVYECGMPVDGPAHEYVDKYKAFFDRGYFNKDKSLSENLDPFRSRYTPAQFAYFEGIDRIYANAADLSEVESKLAALEDQAVASLARGEADLQVLGTVSVARASLQVWKSRNNSNNSPIFNGSAGYRGAQGVGNADAGGYVLGTHLYNGPVVPGDHPGALLGSAMQMAATESFRAALNGNW